MRTEDALLLQALKLKELNTRGHSGPDMIDCLIASNPEEVKEKMHNICAFISHELFNEVEGVCQLLSFSKREVVEMALIDFIQKASKVIEDTGAFSEGGY